MKKIIRLLLITCLCTMLFACNLNSGNNNINNDSVNNVETPSNTPSEGSTNLPEDPTNNPSENPTDNPTEPEVEDPININYTKTVEMIYEFVGDEKDKAGFAQGYITINPLQNAKKSGFYLVFLANDNGLLKEYDEFACIEITGGQTTFYVKDGRYIPAEATLLAVFETTTRTLSGQPAIQSAADIIRIPKAKRLNLGTETLTLGMTSDIHINFESLGFGSRNKWKNTLNFFSNNKTDYVIITGDMTGETNLDDDYTYYINTIKSSSIPLENVYESIGNHGNSPSMLSVFTKYTSGSNEIHPYANSAYYHVVLQNNVFIFMAQELQGPSDSAVYDNFSKAQIDWLEGLLAQYGNTDKNVFITIHSPFLNFGPGDRHDGDYVRMITFKEEYVQTMRLKRLLETYKDVIVLSGHTHLTYYEGENYSNENDSFARMIHVSSGTQTSSYNHGTKLISDTDGRKNNDAKYGSEGYIVKIYNDYILFIGYNISTNKIIPAGCILLPKKAYGGTYKEPGSQVTTPEDLYSLLQGDGTITNPYQISTEEQFLSLTKAFTTSTSKTESEMLGYNKYFIQTRDLDMTKIKAYKGTNASGSTRYTFAGTYNGNGHTIKVSIDGGDNRSVFPYVYGNIVNLKIEGSITGTTCAQPVRALYGHIINCIFDLTLTAPQAAGMVYSNYGYIYNSYATGTLNASSVSPIAIGNSSTSYHNVYYNYQNVSCDYGTNQSNTISLISGLNNPNHSEHQTALSYIKGINLNKIVAKNNKLTFE